MAPLLGDLIKGGGLGAWSQKYMERPHVGRGGVFRQITSNWFQTCTSRIAFYISCMNEVKKGRWQNIWLDLCTKQVVNARACAYQFLPYSSSGIYLVGKRTVQADSCLHPQKIHTLFTSVGEGAFWAAGPKFTRDSDIFVLTACF